MIAREAEGILQRLAEEELAGRDDMGLYFQARGRELLRMTLQPHGRRNCINRLLAVRVVDGLPDPEAGLRLILRFLIAEQDMCS